MFTPIEYRPKDDNTEFMCCHINPEFKNLSIKLKDEESELDPVNPSWGWLHLLSPYLAPGGKPVALILAVGLAAITISSVTGWSQIILALSVLIVVLSE